MLRFWGSLSGFEPCSLVAVRRPLRISRFDSNLPHKNIRSNDCAIGLARSGFCYGGSDELGNLNQESY